MSEPQEKVTFLLELRKAEDELARLEENAKRLAVDIRKVADWIESAAYPNFIQKMEVQQKRSRVSSEDRSKLYSQSLNFKLAAEMVAHVTKARKKLENLQQRLATFGIE